MAARSTFTPRQRTIVILVALGVIALLLPRAWTGRLISLVQVLVPFQHAATSAVSSTSQTSDNENGDAGVVSRSSLEAAERHNQALRHRMAALAMRVEELEREVGLLTATRLWNVEGMRIGSRGRLIPAQVVAGDLLAWRSSELINAGSLQGVRGGAAVTSNHFTIDRGVEQGLASGMAILLGEVLLGTIEQVGTHTARVKLLSDPTVEMKVRLGRFDGDSFTAADGYFWLVGKGRGRMEIRDVPRRDVDAGHVAVGDVVLSDPLGTALPAAMTIGRVTEILPDRDQPLFSRLRIESPLSGSAPTHVYVFDPRTEAED